MRLLVDCDPGNGDPAADVDDGLALALAWATSGTVVELVSVVDGNVPHARGAGIASGLAELAGQSPILIESMELPLVESSTFWRAEIDERRRSSVVDALWATTAPRIGAQWEVGDAADVLLASISARAPEPATLVSLGPLTTVAAAERRNPGLLSQCARVVVLGGAFTGPIGIRELNFALDPEAADTVLRSGARITLVPLDVTRNSWLTIDDLDFLKGASSPLVRYLATTSRPWVEWIVRTRAWRGSNAHDLLAMAIALEPTLATTRSEAVQIGLSAGGDRSRPVIVPDGAEPNVDLVTDFDEQAFTQLWRTRLMSYGLYPKVIARKKR